MKHYISFMLICAITYAHGQFVIDSFVFDQANLPSQGLDCYLDGSSPIDVYSVRYKDASNSGFSISSGYAVVARFKGDYADFSINGGYGFYLTSLTRFGLGEIVYQTSGGFCWSKFNATEVQAAFNDGELNTIIFNVVDDNPANTEMYVNGTEITYSSSGSDTGTGISITCVDGMYFGDRYAINTTTSTTQFATMVVGEVVVYDAVLTAGEVSDTQNETVDNGNIIERLVMEDFASDGSYTSLITGDEYVYSVRDTTPTDPSQTNSIYADL